MGAINRYFLSERFFSQNEFLKKGVRCIFISHHKSDSSAARKIADYFIAANIEVYFDEYDSSLRVHHQSNNPQKVTEVILEGINNSSDMLVVVSPRTTNSAWVPFEIGYGYGKTRLSVLCLKGILKGTLPEYLRTVPVIRDRYDLNSVVISMTGKTKEKLLETKMLSEFSSPINPLRDVMDDLIID